MGQGILVPNGFVPAEVSVVHRVLATATGAKDNKRRTVMIRLPFVLQDCGLFLRCPSFHKLWLGSASVLHRAVKAHGEEILEKLNELSSAAGHVDTALLMTDHSNFVRTPRPPLCLLTPDDYQHAGGQPWRPRFGWMGNLAFNREIECPQELVGYLDWIEKGDQVFGEQPVDTGSLDYARIEFNVASLVRHLQELGHQLKTSKPSLDEDGWPIDGRSRHDAFWDYLVALRQECKALIAEASRGPTRKPGKRGRPKVLDEERRMRIVRNHNELAKEGRQRKEIAEKLEITLEYLNKCISWYRRRQSRK